MEQEKYKKKYLKYKKKYLKHNKKYVECQTGGIFQTPDQFFGFIFELGLSHAIATAVASSVIDISNNVLKKDKKDKKNKKDIIKNAIKSGGIALSPWGLIYAVLAFQHIITPDTMPKRTFTKPKMTP